MTNLFFIVIAISNMSYHASYSASEKKPISAEGYLTCQVTAGQFGEYGRDGWDRLGTDERLSIINPEASKALAEGCAVAVEAAKESAQAVAVTRTLVRLFPELAGREDEIISIFSEELDRAIKEGRK